MICLGEGRSKNGGFRWTCACDCGRTTRDVDGSELRHGDSESCGCLVPYLTHYVGKRATTHGLSDSSEWRAWCNMRDRCTNPKFKGYENYGGRGITVCAEWMGSFESFFANVGPKPSPEYTLDRIENDGNYEPGNVRWATRKEQQENRRKMRPLTAEHRAKISAANRGKKRTPEQVERMRSAMTMTPEHKDKVRAGVANYWARKREKYQPRGSDIKDGETVCGHGARPFECKICRS